MKKLHRKGTDSFIFRWMIILSCVFLIVFSTLIYLLLHPRDANSQEFYTQNFQLAYSGYPNFFNTEIYEAIRIPCFYPEITSPYFLSVYYYMPPIIYPLFPTLPLNAYYFYLDSPNDYYYPVGGLSVDDKTLIAPFFAPCRVLKINGIKSF